jgi:TolB-like protein/DNA-binding winged helix-turn-helix (wHTH) protein
LPNPNSACNIGATSPSPNMPTSAIYRFGPYEVRTRSREIHNRGTKLKLRPQPFQVLQVLVQCAGDVVTREELRGELWSQETFVDFEHSLNTAIKELRSVLNDSASNPQYIQTVPKVGYRMIAPVAVEEPPNRDESNSPKKAAGVEGSSGAMIHPETSVQRSRRNGWLLPVAIALLAVAGLTAYYQWFLRRNVPHAENRRLMLAVLPFENLTGDVTQDYFSDGLTEEMIAQLGRLDPQHLGVIARTSVMRYKQNHGEVGKIGTELGVQYVLEGSVRRDAGKVRISAQLIQLKDQSDIWSHEYDRELSNLLSLQSEIAQAIAGQIQVALGETKHDQAKREAVTAPKSYDAYDLYLKGLYFWNKRTPQSFSRAVEYFQESARKDPNYARAYAGLADSYAVMSGFSGFSPKELIPKARQAAERAVGLGDSLAEAHTARAVVAQNLDWDWNTAEREYRRAIELDSNYATAHHWYAEFLALMGRFDEASIQIEQARQLDPLSLIIAADRGVILYYAKQYDAAVIQFRAVLEMDPVFPRAQMVSSVYAEKGMYTEALFELNKWRSNENPWYWGRLAYFSGRSGQGAEAGRALEKLQRLNHDHPVDPLVFAVAYIGVADKERAFIWLEKSYAEHSISLTAVKVDPLFNPLRSDGRFESLLKRMNLPTNGAGARSN